ncbi:ATP-binding protein [Methylovulum miyakonense]|uniref:ATP-binding protein n=1 Tax=Methylovulum miyakonense TaxID=645578 RepID=UPI0003A7DB72|nr:ATP-binding protein [Methylovulum miyakonense]
MHLLNRLILIDSYKPGELVEVRLDGHTNLNGVNGAGKTTLLRLIPLFFGERPGRLVPKSRVTDSFAKHYLPNESSYIIFEYQRNEQTCMAVIYAAPSDDGLCYRFVDKGFERDDFIETRRDGTFYPVSCRSLRAHLTKRHINHSDQLTACSDYRTVIQNLPHKKGQEMRQMVARYSFCNHSTGHRLKNIEKIITGMLTRSTDFADLRDMLVNCIEENRDAIALNVQMETLDSWHKEYRAFQTAEAERDKIDHLNQLETEFGQIEWGLGELQHRLRCLLSQNEHYSQQEQDAGNLCHQQLEQIKQSWEGREQQLKSALAEVKAALEQVRRQQTQLVNEKKKWDEQDIQSKNQLFLRLPQIKAHLQQEQENYQRLLTDVQDIDAQYKQFKAEKAQHFAEQINGYRQSISLITLKAAYSKAIATQQNEQQKESFRQTNQIQQDDKQNEQLTLSEARGALNSQITQAQPEPHLLANQEFKQESFHKTQQHRQDAEKALREVEASIKQNQSVIDALLNEKSKQAKAKQDAQDGLALLQKQLDANPDTLLGFLREHQPQWTETIAKVINPELLLREDLEPMLRPIPHSFYGVDLNLDNLPADFTADENKIRTLITANQHQINALAISEAQNDAQLEDLRKTANQLNNQKKAADLKLGQLQTQLNKLTEELSSLKQQIERSKRERAAKLVQDKKTLEEQIKRCNSELQTLKQQLQADLTRLSQELDAKSNQIDAETATASNKIEQLIEQLKEQERTALEQLEQQRLHSLQERKVDTATLTALETSITRLKSEEKAAEAARLSVNDYQHWLENDWSRYDDLTNQRHVCETQIQQQQRQYETEYAQSQQQRKALNEGLERIKSKLDKLAKEIKMINELLVNLSAYSKRVPEQVSFDNAHTLALLHGEYRHLIEQHKEARKGLAALIRHFKQVLARFPLTHPGRYYIRVEDELGFDSEDLAWLERIQAWYASESDTARSWLLSQARLFGSAIRNYQQALARFDRGIDSLSRRLAANIDSNIRFEKIERIEGRLTSKVTSLGYWEQIVRFTKDYDEWNRSNDGALPSQDFADIVQQVAEQLQSKGRVEMKLVNLLELEIMVTENGRTKKATHAEELRQISSHGLSYLILCVFFIALVNMIRKDQPLTIVWPMDELKELHQMNIEMLVDILTKNNISLFSAFPDPDPDVLRLFKNRYQVFGYRQLLEMAVDADYLSALVPLAEEAEHV